MPGLVNSHGHLTYPCVKTLKEMGEMPVEKNVFAALHNARIALDHGFTAVLSGASRKPRLDVALRNEINSGRIPGPRMLAASPEMTVSGGLADGSVWGREVPANGLVADQPQEFRRLVRMMVREGVDLIKFNNSGDSFSWPRAESFTNPMTEEEVRAISWRRTIDSNLIFSSRSPPRIAATGRQCEARWPWGSAGRTSAGCDATR
jgi:imidazolonepropionase-like amidohydrolase